MGIIGKTARFMCSECRAWLEGLLRLLPYSTLGNACRSRYWTWRLNIPRPITVHPGVWFLGVDTLSVGSGASINANVIINACNGHIRIGDHVLIGPNVVMRAANHIFADPSRLIREQGHDGGEIVVEDDCWIGAGAIILKGVTIGRGSVIGAGAVVTRDILPGSVAVGVPAKVIGRRGEGRTRHGDRLVPR